MRTAKPAPAAAVVAAATNTPKPAAAEPTQTPVPAASPASSAASTAPAAVASQAPSDYDERASGVVRRYIEALVRGDEKTAKALLGNEGTFSEQAFLDPSARIVLLKVTRLDASNASVGCEIAAAKGHYYGTYHVKAAAGGPYISEHDYIKV